MYTYFFKYDIIFPCFLQKIKFEQKMCLKATLSKENKSSENIKNTWTEEVDKNILFYI